MSDDLSGDMLAPSWPNLVSNTSSVYFVSIIFGERHLLQMMLTVDTENKQFF